jgi:N-acetylglucosaminyldiphosphoundecaprenol N-acetyl-beta-D-mannosaminyltransferase
MHTMKIINTRLLNLHSITIEDAINTITKYSTSPKLDIVVTPNIDHLARIVSEGSTSPLKAIYSRASICLCDSRILAKLLYFKDKRVKEVKEVITGSTLVV